MESIRSSEKELTKSTSVSFNILNIDTGKTLSNCTSGLIGSKNTLSRSSNVGSIGNKLICREANTEIKTYQNGKMSPREFLNKSSQTSKAITSRGPKELLFRLKLNSIIWPIDKKYKLSLKDLSKAWTKENNHDNKHYS